MSYDETDQDNNRYAYNPSQAGYNMQLQPLYSNQVGRMREDHGGVHQAGMQGFSWASTAGGDTYISYGFLFNNVTVYSAALYDARWVAISLRHQKNTKIALSVFKFSHSKAF